MQVLPPTNLLPAQQVKVYLEVSVPRLCITTGIYQNNHNIRLQGARKMLYIVCPIPSRSSSPVNRLDLADDLSSLAAELSKAVEDFAEQRRKLRHLQQRKQQQKEPMIADLH